MYQHLKSSKAALDLASVLIGVVLIGIIGGVVAATIIVLIPWAQNTTAQNALRSLSTAQESYKLAYDQYANYSRLVETSLINQDASLCSVVSSDGTNYGSAAISSNGKVYANTNMNTDPVEVNVGETTCFGVMVADGTFINPPTETEPVPYTTTSGLNVAGSVTAGGGSGLNPGALVPAPGAASNTATSLDNVTVLNYNCPTTRTVTLPVRGLYGVAIWSDGEYATYSGTNANNITKSLVGGRNYTVTLTGSFRSMFADTSIASSQECLRTVSAWGANTGTTSASYGFRNAVNLTSVATPPATITNMEGMFYGASRFNGSVNTWNVSNVTNMRLMFTNATVFNQNVGSWNVGNVTNMSSMFYFNSAFNNGGSSSINNWNTSRVTTTASMFAFASVFNQPIGNWNTGSVTAMSSMFYQATNFNQNINNWNVSNVTTMSHMLNGTRAFNQPLNNWNTSRVTDMSYMFHFSVFNQNVGSWNVGNVTNMTGMFIFGNFNQNINSWNVSNVTNMANMFTQSSFNQPLNNWNTSRVTNMSYMFSGSNAGNQPFNQNISNWNVNAVSNWTGFRQQSNLSTPNTPPKFR